jgi:hypothetical protein
MVLRGPFTLPHPGAYHWSLSLDGQRRALTSFLVEKVQLPAGPAPRATAE